MLIEWECKAKIIGSLSCARKALKAMEPLRFRVGLSVKVCVCVALDVSYLKGITL